MYNQLIQITLKITTPKNGMRDYYFRQRTERLYDGNTTGENGKNFSFTLILEGDQWAFGEEQAMPQWLKTNESEVIAVFSTTTIEVEHGHGRDN